jgi:hypothetical protein
MVIFGRLILKIVLKVCFRIGKKNRILSFYILELNQEEEDRRKQEVEAVRPMEDDSIEPEETTEVSIQN